MTETDQREKARELAASLFVTHAEPCEHIAGLVPDEPPYRGHECVGCIEAAIQAAWDAGLAAGREEIVRLEKRFGIFDPDSPRHRRKEP